MQSSPDVVIIGSGIGGATVAYGLASSGARILVLERGERILEHPDTRDERAIFRRDVFKPKDALRDETGSAFTPNNHACVGGNSKFYGAVMLRFREQDFLARDQPGGTSVAWPLTYADLEPWYCEAEQLFRIRGQIGEDPTEPAHSHPYRYTPVPDEPAIAMLRERLLAQGLNPFSLPLAIDIDAWLAGGATPWDAFPNTGEGKIDAETGPLAAALASPNVTLQTGATVVWLETDASGKSVVAVHVQLRGETIRITPKLVVLAVGAINSAALLLRSANTALPRGLANSSDQVGRNFMNHNSTAMLAMHLGTPNPSIYQKTLGLNDFYLKDPVTGYPLGNAQLLGKVSGAILKANLRFAPEPMLAMAAHRSFDWYLQSEDLAHPESRVRIDGNGIVLQWVRSNLQAHALLVERMRNVLRQAGFPIILTKPFDKHATSHQCGTVRIGADPATAPLDSFCRSYDHSNLYVVDGSFLPSSAAVNPALTIAAQALRVAHHITSDKPLG